MSDSKRRASLSDLSVLQLALLAQETRERAEAALRADPVAIIGMGCRLPGNVQHPEDFWALLRDGIDAVSAVPADRWNVDAVYNPDPAEPGKMATKWGGFIGAIDGFDAAFFGILPREAERMDPQQRLFLEVAQEALDHAGLPRERLAGSRTGVYVASYHSDYAHLEYNDPETIDARTLTGTVHAVIPNRLSYLLDLRGPSISIDTACSSSLVAIHMACQSLRQGESDIAVAGGVSLMVTESLMISLSKVGFMAPDGRCKTFDASADGFGRGEGCSVIVLKRLADAIADGDRVLAVVRGSVVNQDGHSTVLAAPNGLAQQALIREALVNAQVEPSRIGYVEAHGTGTALGDPIEVEALAATVGQPVPGAGPCLIGAAKANIGHLEAAAGVTGVVKSVLMLQHEAIPPQVHFKTLSPHISLAGTRLSIPTQLTPWKAGTTPRLIGTSGFGVGGTNAHVILEEAPGIGEAGPTEWAPAPWLLPLSAQSPQALRALAGRWVDVLASPAAPLAALCAAAGERRSHYDHRLGAVAGSADEMRERLRAFVAGDTHPSLATGRRPVATALRVAFVFSGQGQQWLGMGRELLACEPVFRDALVDLDARLRRHVDWSLLEELAAPEGRARLDDTDVAQPAIFAIQLGLVALWASWGIHPDGVVGHSIGEIAALHVAGVLSLDDAVRVVVHRARSMQRATGQGAMAAVGLTETEARQRLRAFDGRLSVAAVNSPRGVVLSGEAGALSHVLKELESAGVSQRGLPVNYAFHSAQMQPYADELVAVLGRVDCAVARVPVYSTVEGRALGERRLDAAYFGRNVRETVRFADAVSAMIGDGFTSFVEIAAHPVLASAVADCAADHAEVLPPIASMRRSRPQREAMLQACAGLYAAGGRPDWLGLQRAPAAVVDLPQYPWQRERYWLRPRPAASAMPTSRPAGDDGLLGRRVPMAEATVFESSWPAPAPAWLADHRIRGRLLMPGMAVLEALRAAAAHVLGTTDVEVSGLVLQRALVLDAQLDGAVAPGSTWQVVARQAADALATGAPVELMLYQATRLDDAVPCLWEQVASAHAQPTAVSRAERLAATTPDERGDGGPVEADIAAVYQSFLDAGAEFGPVFRSIHRLKYEAASATVWLQRPHADGGDGLASSVHPAVLDGAVQAALVASGTGTLRALLLPFTVDRFVVRAPVPGALTAQVRWAAPPGDTTALTVDADFHAHDGTLVARLEGVRCVRPRAETLPVQTAGADPWLHEVVWRTETDAPATAAEAPGAWMLLCDDAGTGDALAAALRADGQPCLCVVAGERLQRSGSDRATVDPLRAEHLEALLSDPAWRAGQRLSGVVHLWSLDLAGRPPDDETLADLQGRCEAEDRRAAISALALVQAAARAASAAGADTQVVFVTADAQPGGTPVARVAAAGLWGLANAVAAEHPELAVRAIDLDLDAVDVTALAAELRRGRTAAPRLLNRGARRLVPMLHRRPAAGERSVQLAPGPSSTLEDLRWIPCAPPPPGPGEVRVRVAATGLNFRDVLLALGMIPREEAFFGAECAGVVEAVGAGVDDLEPGDAVFGFAPHSLATVLNVPAAFLSRWPHELGSMELAASLPVAYLTALLGFDRHARLKAGDRVLIHAAAGGVGLAAVRLAQRAGAEVFATAGSPAKRALLASLGVGHVFDSRRLEFASQVRASTGGAGVDVVLNSLAGAFIGASVEALAPQGCFLELGKRDVWSAEHFHAVRPQARYCVYDLGRSAEAEPGIVRPMLDQVLVGLREGRLAPLPLRAFEFSDVGDAMRLMAQARHTGKLVLRAPSIASSQPLVRQDASYWITGGLGALGLHTARWLAGHGARHLVLTSRGAPGLAAAEVVRDLEAQGISVLVRQADAGDAGQMRAVFDDIARDLPPLRGVVHAAGALDDGVLLQQDDRRLAGVMRGKSQGARILDALTRPVALDFFIMYSAAGLLLGPAGQGPYAAANAQLDALAHARRAAGLPALSVAWGLWLEGGMATTSASAGQNPWVARGLGWIEPAEAFVRLERLLREGAVQTAVLPIDWTRFLARVPSGVDPRFFEPLVGERRAASAGAAQPGASPQVRLGRADVWRSLPASQRRSAVQDHVTEQTLQVLGLPATTELDTHAPLKDAGLDSLMAVELRNALARSLGHALPATLLFDHPSLEALSTHVLRTLGLVEPEPAATRHDVEASSQARSDVAELTDAEAEAQLLAELENTTPRRRP